MILFRGIIRNHGIQFHMFTYLRCSRTLTRSCERRNTHSYKIAIRNCSNSQNIYSLNQQFTTNAVYQADMTRSRATSPYRIQIINSPRTNTRYQAQYHKINSKIYSTIIQFRLYSKNASCASNAPATHFCLSTQHYKKRSWQINPLQNKS